MIKKSKKIISTLLSIAMIGSIVPTSFVSADSVETIKIPVNVALNKPATQLEPLRDGTFQEWGQKEDPDWRAAFEGAGGFDTPGASAVADVVTGAMHIQDHKGNWVSIVDDGSVYESGPYQGRKKGRPLGVLANNVNDNWEEPGYNADRNIGRFTACLPFIPTEIPDEQKSSNILIDLKDNIVISQINYAPHRAISGEVNSNLTWYWKKYSFYYSTDEVYSENMIWQPIEGLQDRDSEGEVEQLSITPTEMRFLKYVGTQPNQEGKWGAVAVIEALEMQEYDKNSIPADLLSGKNGSFFDIPFQAETEKALLKVEIDKYELLNKESYTSKSWPLYEESYNRAIILMQNLIATKQQVSAEIDEMKLRNANLVKRGDKTTLKSLIADAESKDINAYITTTWNSLQTALTNAKKTNDDIDVTQIFVTISATALQNAINNLQQRGNKTALNQLIQTAKAMEQGEYNNTTWNKFLTALTNANAVNDGGADYTQVQIDTVQNALNNAITSLSTAKYKLGDADMNDKIDALDITAIQNHILGGTQLTGDAFLAADANGDEKVNALDITAIQNHILGGTQLV